MRQSVRGVSVCMHVPHVVPVVLADEHVAVGFKGNVVWTVEQYMVDWNAWGSILQC
jgi:hypothetical protein